MKKLLIAFILSAVAFSSMAAEGYNSPDVKYAKPCVAEAKQKAEIMLKTYAAMGEWDYDLINSLPPTFPKAFKNPVRPEQYIHPIEFTAAVSRFIDTRIRVMYANSSTTDPSLCVFMGIEFLDLTDAN
ncbi:hypothetical protein CENTIMANUS_00096 [Klebsiella phage vB_KpM_Centimanus]